MIVAMVNEEPEEAVIALTPKLTPDIYAVAKDKLAWVFAGAFHNVYMTAAIFASVSVLAALITKGVSKNATNNVAVRLENEKAWDEKLEL